MDIDDTRPTGRRRSTRHGPPPEFPRVATIRPWVDPLVDRRGHDPRSRYVEHFWLGVIGPTATWLMRRVAAYFDNEPDGGRVDLEQLAGSLGLSLAKGATSPFGRALQRCVMFGAARALSTGEIGWEVRRRLPTVAHRHLRKLPPSVQLLHAGWDHVTVTDGTLDRALRLATAMRETGDTVDLVEAQLVALGIEPVAASAVCEQLRRAS